jgi:hypothetical protein
MVEDLEVADGMMGVDKKCKATKDKAEAWLGYVKSE